MLRLAPLGRVLVLGCVAGRDGAECRHGPSGAMPGWAAAMMPETRRVWTSEYKDFTGGGLGGKRNERLGVQYRGLGGRGATRRAACRLTTRAGCAGAVRATSRCGDAGSDGSASVEAPSGGGVCAPRAWGPRAGPGLWGKLCGINNCWTVTVPWVAIWRRDGGWGRDRGGLSVACAGWAGLDGVLGVEGLRTVGLCGAATTMAEIAGPTACKKVVL